jgi:thioredoxin reductase (NADPH)
MRSMTERASGSDEQHFDIAIIGGGPAGLSAAIWAARYLHSVCVLDSGDPRNWETRGINGFLGLSGVRPPELRLRGRDECRKLGVTLIDTVVLRAEKVGDEEFELCVEGGAKVHARRLLLAIGVRDVWPEIPGLDHAYGANAHVCPDCDGYEACDKKVVVIGHGRRAIGLALNLTTWTSDIIICTNGREPGLDDPEYREKLDGLNIPVLVEPIERVCCVGREIHCLMLEGGMQLDCDKVFFTIGQYPADDLGVQLGCERDEEGHVIVDPHGHTSIEHVYAAGDLIPGSQLAITAAAEGATAAMAIHKSLVPEGRRLVPRVPAMPTTSR